MSRGSLTGCVDVDLLYGANIRQCKLVDGDTHKTHMRVQQTHTHTFFLTDGAGMESLRQ